MRERVKRIGAAAVVAVGAFTVFAAEDVKTLHSQAKAALKAGQVREAVKIAQQIAEADPNNAEHHFLAGMIFMQAREHTLALKAFEKAAALDPRLDAATDRIGDARLKLGDITGAIEAFDAYLKRNPAFAPEHWRRGIALYYAGRYADGAAQFELHRTVNPEDVENSVWHYLCNVKAQGKEKALKELIPVKKDARVPMAQVLELFAGRRKPEEVIAAAEASGLQGARLTSARFYAHLYVALHYESENDPEKTRYHLREAVQKYVVPDYMWDVAKVHLKRLEDASRK